MRILITGATGFIGKNLCEKLLAGKHELMAVSRQPVTELMKDAVLSRVKWISSSLNLNEQGFDQLKAFGPEIVIDLAWEKIPDFSFAVSLENLNNQLSFFNKILEIPSVKKVVVAGSAFEYNKKQGACIETEICIPHNHFTWAKNSLKEFLQFKCLEKNITLAWTRIFYVYGPGQRSGSLIPTIIRSLLNGQSPGIRTPQNANDFIYIDDVSLGLMALAEKNIPSGVYNLGSGEARKVGEVVRMVEKCIIVPDSVGDAVTLVPDSVGDENGDESWGDITHTTKTINWKPVVSLEEGIRKTIDRLR